MVAVQDKQTAGIVVTLLMILSGAVVVIQPMNTYYCASEDSVKEFVRLSSSGITGYDRLGRGDRCVGGIWEPINKYLKENRITSIISCDGDWIKTDVPNRYKCDFDKQLYWCLYIKNNKCANFDIRGSTLDILKLDGEIWAKVSTKDGYAICSVVAGQLWDTCLSNDSLVETVEIGDVLCKDGSC